MIAGRGETEDRSDPRPRTRWRRGMLAVLGLAAIASACATSPRLLPRIENGELVFDAELAERRPRTCPSDIRVSTQQGEIVWEARLSAAAPVAAPDADDAGNVIESADDAAGGADNAIGNASHVAPCGPVLPLRYGTAPPGMVNAGAPQPLRADVVYRLDFTITASAFFHLAFKLRDTPGGRVVEVVNDRER